MRDFNSNYVLFKKNTNVYFQCLKCGKVTEGVVQKDTTIPYSDTRFATKLTKEITIECIPKRENNEDFLEVFIKAKCPICMFENSYFFCLIEKPRKIF